MEFGEMERSLDTINGAQIGREIEQEAQRIQLSPHNRILKHSRVRFIWCFVWVRESERDKVGMEVRRHPIEITLNARNFLLQLTIPIRMEQCFETDISGLLKRGFCCNPKFYTISWASQTNERQSLFVQRTRSYRRKLPIWCGIVMAWHGMAVFCHWLQLMLQLCIHYHCFE